MKNHSKVNAWMAEKCGVAIYRDAGHYWIRKESTDITMEEEWTILDPRCREIIRERFKITTRYTPPNEYGWVAMEDRLREWDTGDAICLNGKGATIAESEINCILAIYEAEHE